MVERHQILTVHVLHCHAKPHIGMPHLHQCLERLITSVKTVGNPPDFIIRLLQSLDADADSHLRKLPAERNNAVREIAVSRYDNPVRFLVQLTHDIRDILSDKGLPARDVRKRHLRQLFDILQRDLLLRPGRIPKAVAHVTSRVTSVGHYNRAI